MENISYLPERLADAHELMGSTFFNDHNDTQTALKYWRTGMTIRNNNMVDDRPLPKRPIMTKKDSFRNATEFATMDELNSVMLDLDAIRIQSLLICERVLGPHHKDTLFRLMFRGASYADALRYVFSRSRLFENLTDQKSKIQKNYFYHSFYLFQISILHRFMEKGPGNSSRERLC